MPWNELKRIQACCEVRMESYLGPGDELRWRVIVRHKDRPFAEPINIDGPELRDAVLETLAEARRRGWISK